MGGGRGVWGERAASEAGAWRRGNAGPPLPRAGTPPSRRRRRAKPLPAPPPVRTVVVAAAVGAAAHGHDPARLGHLVVDLSQRGRHLVGQRARHNHAVRLARRGAEDDAEAVKVVARRACGGGGQRGRAEGEMGRGGEHVAAAESGAPRVPPCYPTPPPRSHLCASSPQRSMPAEWHRKQWRGVGQGAAAGRARRRPPPQHGNHCHPRQLTRPKVMGQMEPLRACNRQEHGWSGLQTSPAQQQRPAAAAAPPPLPVAS